MMEDITRDSMDVLMRHAPVWAASMAGRTKVFITDSVPTAQVSGSNGRFKIEINPKHRSDLPFVLMHEVAHIFREDIKSMKKNPHISNQINIAADCIINDSLAGMGIPISSGIKKMACWGQDFYKQDCSKMSINSLMKIQQQESATATASAPGNVSPQGESTEGDEDGEEARGGETGGVGDDFSGFVGVGDSTLHGDPRKLAQSVVSYARRMFFETGFKSKNLSTKYDWRRNRSAFATRTDVVIPRTTVGEYGHNTEGPLVNLVLDTSGSMHESWISTAAVIAREIDKAGLDYDLWLTPSRMKAKNPGAVLDALQEGEYLNGRYDIINEVSNFRSVGLENRVGPHTKRDIPLERRIGHGANELREIVYFETEDPVVWIYVGDYCSSIDYELFLDKNFLHIPMVGSEADLKGEWTGSVFTEMEKRSLPRWFYKV